LIDVIRGDVLGEPHRRRIAEVLTQGFAEDFAYFSRDPATLADLFEPMLLLDRFHVALIDGQPAAVASLTEGAQQCFDPRWSQMRRTLGFTRSVVVYWVIRSYFMSTPTDARQGKAEIGFVASAPAHRGRGAATALLQHLLRLPDHREYVLEDIKDTNAAALGLYRKLGFTVYKSRPVRAAKKAGFTEYVSMRLVQSP